MTKKRFTTKNGVFYTDNKTGWEFQSYGEVVKLMNELADENEQLKKQLREEQCRTTPISLTTHISDDDFKKIELMLKKYFGDLE
jgi:hypothetical protein